MNTTVVSTTPRPPLRLARRLAALAAPVLLLLGLAVVSAPSASAVTWTNHGSNGLAYTYPTAVGQYVMKAVNGYTSTMSGVRVPGMVLGRSPATSGAQMVTYNIAVERYNGSSWVQVQTAGTGSWKVQLTSARTLMETHYLQLGQSGYYRVNMGINWYDANHRWLGGRAYYLNAAGDYGCNIAACQVGPGWIRL